DRVRELDRDRPHRSTASRAVRLYPWRDGEARRRVVDLARSRAAVRDRDRECSADRAEGFRDVDLAEAQDPDPRRRAIKIAALHAILSLQEGHRSVPGRVRSVQAWQTDLTFVHDERPTVGRCAAGIVAG